MKPLSVLRVVFARRALASTPRLSHAALSVVRQPLAIRCSYATAGLTQKSASKSDAVEKAPRKTKAKASTKTSTAKSTKAQRKTPAVKSKAKPPKALTEEQKAEVQAKKKAEKAKVQAKKKAEKKAEQVKQLKRIALQAPSTRYSLSAWGEFLQARLKEMNHDGPMTEKLQLLSTEYKRLSPSEKENLNEAARSRAEAREAAYESWVASHPVQEILKANQARQRLRTLSKKSGAAASSHKRKWPYIKDARLPAKPISPFGLFNAERARSDDVRHIPLADRTKLVAAEWYAMGEDQKKEYLERARTEVEAYHAEMARLTKSDSA